MENIGTTMLAKTYVDFVCFDITICPRYFEEAMDIMLLLLTDFDWDEDNFNKERSVVKKQIDFNSLSFEQSVEKTYFSGTKMEMPIMGTFESVEKISVDQLNKWKKSFFNTYNVLCVLTGAFSDEHYKYFIDKLEAVEVFGAPIPNQTPIIPKKFCQRSYRSDCILNTKWDVSDVLITIDVDTSKINKKNARILCSALSEGIGSRLSLVLREQEALTDEVFGEFKEYFGFGKISIEFAVNNKDLERALTFCFIELVNYKKNFSIEDINSTRTFFFDNQTFVLDSSRDHNFYLGYNYLNLEKVNEVYEEMDFYNNIQFDIIKNDCEKLFVPSNVVVTLTNNKKLCSKHRIVDIIKEFRESLLYQDY